MSMKRNVSDVQDLAQPITKAAFTHPFKKMRREENETATLKQGVAMALHEQLQFIPVRGGL
eukprot:5606164-Amphidinium_carterae.1